MIFQREPLLAPDRAALFAERQRILRELLRVNHQIGLLAQAIGLTVREALELCKEQA